MRASQLVLAPALLVFAASCSSSTSPGGFPTSDATADTRADSAVTVDTSVRPDSSGGDTATVDTSMTDTAKPPVTLKALQDPTDAAHPATGSRVELADSDLVALTPRILVGSSTGMTCRFAVWIGKPGGGNHAGVQVQELIDRGSATNCFGVMPGKIPAMVTPGDRITDVEGTYGEFCAGPMGTPATMCRAFEQSQIFLGGMTSKLTFGGAGTAPTATALNVADLVKDASGGEGPRALALEGTLVRVSNVKVLQELSGTFTATLVVDSSDTTSSKKLEIQISNFPNTGCVRAFFADKAGMAVASITGVLVPDFGRWKIRIRDEKDVSGVTCAAPDAG